MKHDWNTEDNAPHAYRRDGRRVVYRGEAFPLSAEGLRREMIRCGYDLRNQLCYLHRAEEAFSIANPDLMEMAGEWIDRLQRQFDVMSQRRQRTQALIKEFDSIGLPTDATALPPSEKEVSTSRLDSAAPLRSFFWKSGKASIDGVRDLQRNLWNAKLLAQMSDGERDTALLIALGVGRYAGNPPQRMTWLGKTNQLHCFVEMMVGGGYVDCRGGSKWMTAADLFVPADPSRRYTAKRISDARAINADDERQVRRCLPATLA